MFRGKSLIRIKIKNKKIFFFHFLLKEKSFEKKIKIFKLSFKRKKCKK